MIDIVEIKDLSDYLIQEFKLDDGDKLYDCFLDKEKIGYAIIRNSLDDKLFLALFPKYQNKGYGSALFKLLLSKVDKPVYCLAPINNYQIARIILNTGGIEISRNGEFIHYVIEKR